MDTLLQFFGGQLIKLFAFNYGLFTLSLAQIYALCQDETWKPTPERERQRFRKATQTLWSLTLTPSSDLIHNFLSLPNSNLQLHYLTPTPNPSTPLHENTDLVIFLHGFPDTSHIWHHQLLSPLAQHAQLVALDLPGCGGSSRLPSYGADEMLNAVAEGIAQLKLRYLDANAEKSGRCIVVSHDWGGVISFRLAAHSSTLFDECVVLNSAYAPAARARISTLLTTARTALSPPSGERDLPRALHSLAPVTTQLWKSGYIFLFNLPSAPSFPFTFSFGFPFKLAGTFPWVAKALLRFCHCLAYRHLPEPLDAEVEAEAMASSCGPGPAELATRTAEEKGYDGDVARRARTKVRGDWDERIRIYREGLVTKPWTPTYTGSQLATADGMQGGRQERDDAFKVPVDVVFGMQDPALDPRVALEGVEDWFMPAAAVGTGPGAEARTEAVKEEEEDENGAGVKRGKVVKLRGCGHWCMLEPEGQEAIQSLLMEKLRRRF